MEFLKKYFLCQICKYLKMILYIKYVFCIIKILWTEFFKNTSKYFSQGTYSVYW